MLMMNTLVLISDCVCSDACFVPDLCFFFLSTREHKTLVLVLTVSNRIVCSQNS